LSGTFRDRAQLRQWIASVAGLSLASARLDALTEDRLVLTLAASKAGLENALRLIKQTGSSFGLREPNASRPDAKLQRLGLDLEASLSSDA
jgi:hypothetical protein